MTQILVNRDLLLEINKLLYDYDMLRDDTRAYKLRIPLKKLLKDNPEPIKGKCKICGMETNDKNSWADLNYCPCCWNKGLAKEHKQKLEEYQK
jgi:hypothetical protein